jgi:hypothetical protein
MVYRGTKGSPLTNAEVDGNFQNLDTYKAPLDNPAFTTAVGVTGSVTAVSASGALIASNGSGTGQTSIQLKRVGAATDQKMYEVMQDSTGNFVLRSINDAYTSNFTFLSAKRSTTYTLASLQLMGSGGRVLIGTGADDGVNALQVTGNIEGDSKLSLTGTTSGIELGSTTSTGTPTVDFHSSGTTADYDARISATGGSATVGQGTLTATALNIILTSGGSPTLTLNNGGRALLNTSTDDGATMLQIKSGATGHGLTVQRNAQSLQYISIDTASGLDTNASADNKIVSYSPTTAAKPLYIHSTTDEAGTAATNGVPGINFKVYNATYGRFWSTGRFGLGASVTDDGSSQLQVQGTATVTGDIVGTGSSTVRSDYRFVVARNSTSFNPYMYIINSAWTQSALPTSQTLLGQISNKWGSTTADDTAGTTASDILTYGNTDGTANMLLQARNAAGTATGKVWVNGSGTVVVNSSYDDKSTIFIVNKAASASSPINTPTTRIIDDGNATSGGLAIESYQPIIQLIDRSTGAKNSRIMQNSGTIYFANDPGDNSGSYAAPGFTVNPDGYIQVGSGGAPSINVWAYLNGSSVGTGASQYGVYFNGEFNSAATSTGYSFLSTPKVQAASFTMASLNGFYAQTPVLGSGATVTAYRAFYATDSSIAGSNFGFYSNMGSGANKWNFYANGSALSYFNGAVLIGSTTDNGVDKLQVTGSATVTGNVNVGSVTFPDGTVQLTAPMGRNRIINGACDILQRAATFVASNAGTQAGYSVDRMRTAMTLTTGVITQGQNAGGITDPYSGIAKNSVYAIATTPITSISATGSLAPIGQYIEGFNCYDLVGQPVTVSFLFRSSVSGLYSVTLRDGTATQTCVMTFNYTAVTPFTRVVLTFPTLPLNLAVPKSASAGLYLFIGGIGTQTATSTVGSWVTGGFSCATGSVNWASTTNNAIWVTDLQLEAGTVATPFERRSYGQERALCQRYFQIFYNCILGGYGTAGSGIWATYTRPVEMRTTPTTKLTSTPSYNNGSGISCFYAATDIFKLTMNVTTGPGAAYCDSATFTFDAEF